MKRKASLHDLTLAQLRKRRGLSQSELAGLVGVNRSMICLIESGKRIPSLDLVDKLAFVLNYSGALVYSCLVHNTLPALYLSGWSSSALRTQRRFQQRLAARGYVLPRDLALNALEFVRIKRRVIRWHRGT